MLAFTKFSLARQFLFLSLIILLAGMIVIGLWLQEQIQWAVVNQTAAVTSLYVDSFISPHLQDLANREALDDANLSDLNRLLSETSLGQQIVSFKVWAPDGEILFSTNPDLIGHTFSISWDLARALQGEVNSNLSGLNEPENAYEAQNWDALIETYAPVRADGTGQVIAVSEFYQTPEALMADVRAARLGGWLIVGTATVVMYLMLGGVVGRASSLILKQQAELEGKISSVRDALAANRRLEEQVRRAAARRTALVEQHMSRVSADLHDGPAQNIALALLRLQSLFEACDDCPGAANGAGSIARDHATVRSALDMALSDLRGIAAGLRLPEVDSLSLAETARRVVRDHERLTARTVDITIGRLPEQSQLPIKITLYRLLQEALANGFKHADGARQKVEVAADGKELSVEVSDDGPGFNSEIRQREGLLGLVGMRERVEVLGGRFEILSGHGQGTTIRARIPLVVPEEDGD